MHVRIGHGMSSNMVGGGGGLKEEIYKKDRETKDKMAKYSQVRNKQDKLTVVWIIVIIIIM